MSKMLKLEIEINGNIFVRYVPKSWVESALKADEPVSISLSGEKTQ